MKQDAAGVYQSMLGVHLPVYAGTPLKHADHFPDRWIVQVHLPAYAGTPLKQERGDNQVKRIAFISRPTPGLR